MESMMKKGQSQKFVSKPKLKNTVPTKATTSSGGKSNVLTVNDTEGKSRERMMTELSMSPFVANANTARTFGCGAFGDLDLSESIGVMRERVEKVNAGDMSDVEATLTAQAAALDVVFNELARRAALNMGEHLNATETYLRLAFKAQAQCRATLETLAEVKYPKAATFVRQQNVAYQQQVNNGDATDIATSTRTPAHAHGKTSNQSNELLEVQHGERLDGGATGTASAVNRGVEAVGAVNRSKDTAG